MKPLFSLIVLLFTFTAIFAQPQDIQTLHTTAKDFIKQGDYENATLVLTKALAQDPNNLEMQKDQAFLEYLKRDYAKSMELSKTLVERPDADVQSFQILGMSYKAIAEYREARKMYERALKKFPASGVLYNEYGEIFLVTEDEDNAITQFEKGIEVEPGFGGNYYYASKYYAEKNDYIWAMLYAENFINIESLTQRTVEIKNLLLETLKKFFTQADVAATYIKKGNDFAKRVAETFARQSAVATTGITPETIMAVRARFILDWYENHHSKYPVKLFEYHKQLLQDGYFEAYTQWLFGAATSSAAYQNWLATHKEQMDAFQKFQRGRLFKIPAGQYYHK